MCWLFFYGMNPPEKGSFPSIQASTRVPLA